jgi:hypothetical protein
MNFSHRLIQMSFKLSDYLKPSGTIITLTDAPAQYICQSTGYTSQKRVGFPAFLLTNAKPSPSNQTIRGCFANWNVAWRFILHHREEIGEELYKRLESWLVETATQGLSEEVKRTFQPALPFRNLKIQGGEMTVEAYMDAVRPFTIRAISIQDEIAAQQEKKEESKRNPKSARRDWKSVVTTAAAANPDVASFYTVGVLPSLSMWSVNGTDAKNDGYKEFCRKTGHRVAKTEQTDVVEYGAPDSFGKRQNALIDTWKPLAGVDGPSKKRPSDGPKPERKKPSKQSAEKSTPKIIE